MSRAFDLAPEALAAAEARAAAAEAPAPVQMPVPEIIVRGTHVRIDQVQPGPAQLVPVLAVRSLHVEIQVALQDDTIDRVIDALTEIRRTRRGFTVAGADTLAQLGR